MKFRFKKLESGQHYGNWEGLQKAIQAQPDVIVEVRKYDQQKEISLAQMAYLHSVVFPALAEYMGTSQLAAELYLKAECGEQFFVKMIEGEKHLLSKTYLNTKQTTIWLENIWDFMDSIGCPVPPPDKDWRVNNEQLQQNHNHG